MHDSSAEGREAIADFRLVSRIAELEETLAGRGVDENGRVARADARGARSTADNLGKSLNDAAEREWDARFYRDEAWRRFVFAGRREIRSTFSDWRESRREVRRVVDSHENLFYEAGRAESAAHRADLQQRLAELKTQLREREETIELPTRSRARGGKSRTRNPALARMRAFYSAVFEADPSQPPDELAHPAQHWYWNRLQIQQQIAERAVRRTTARDVGRTAAAIGRAVLSPKGLR